MIDLYLKAVAVVSIGGDRGQRGVSLGAQADIAQRFPVDYKVAEDILLIGAVFQKAFPVVGNDIDRMDPALVEQPVLITDRPRQCRYTQPAAVHKQHGYEQRHCQHNTADLVDPSAFQHIPTSFSLPSRQA